MSSILTNNGAMVALQTLQSINKNLGMTQAEISTGKSVANAKDNSAVWAISKQMDSDVKGFMAISESLSLGESTVAVARSAAETVTDLLTDIKGKIVAAQEQNVDRSKIQTDIDALTDQIRSVVGAAQFNGLNLVNGSSSADVDVLSSLDRSATGVASSSITVARQDLSIATTGGTPATYGANLAAGNTAYITTGAGGAGTGAANSATVADGGDDVINIVSTGDGIGYRITLSDAATGNNIGTRTFEYVAGADDSLDSVAATLQNQINTFMAATGETGFTVSRDGAELTLNNDSGSNVTATIEASSTGTAGTNPGGLGALASIDVTTDTGATGALTAIEGLIQTSIDAAAAFGSVQGRIETQSEFISNLTDSLTSGIGSLVDANMEEASARLQALQVQQQLATQSLSIANQAPQSILALFR
ncbi:flagellin [Jannaschia marina]|uniref:flagellin n=1 Tax=Jannaschia marina TaxID=2741674 RepID=UPI0015C8711E|nr:flagellin [Jannaschia marina]